MWFMWCNLDGGESQFILDLVYDININLHPKVYIWFNLSISSVYFIFIIFVSVWLLTIFRLFTTLRSLQLSSLHEEPWHLRGRLFIALFVEAMFSLILLLNSMIVIMGDIVMMLWVPTVSKSPSLFLLESPVPRAMSSMAINLFPCFLQCYMQLLRTCYQHLWCYEQHNISTRVYFTTYKFPRQMISLLSFQ